LSIEVLLEHQSAMARDHHGMHVGIGGREFRRDTAQA
jgi:hypothetical protein